MNLNIKKWVKYKLQLLKLLIFDNKIRYGNRVGGFRPCDSNFNLFEMYQNFDVKIRKREKEENFNG